MLNKITAAAAIGVGIFAVIAIGNSAPPPAKAYGIGGYTYTQRVCQEYGQQPRWYNVRDGQAAYNGGNSDSGWLIVLEHGGHVAATPERAESYELVSNPADGDYIRYRPYPGAAWAYLQVTGNLFVRSSGGVNTPTTSRSAATHIRAPSGTYYAYHPATFHYRRIPASPYIPARGGQYVRWANMAWCR